MSVDKVREEKVYMNEVAASSQCKGFAEGRMREAGARGGGGAEFLGVY